MANEIKDLFGSSTAFNITIASVGSSTSQAGQQSDFVDNSTSKNMNMIVYYKFMQGTTPTGNRALYIYLLRGDKSGTAHRDGGASSSAGALTLGPDLVPIFIAANKASPSTGDVLQGSFVVEKPGPEFAIAFYHDTGVNSDSTAGNHWFRYVLVDPEIQ